MTRVLYLDGPVAIIGAGIGGLTAALSLQHFGLPVRVFEQARALREIGRDATPPTACNWPPATRERNIMARPRRVPTAARRPRRSACSRTTR
ncbi:MAG TPA: FAD-binding protein [Streptosporangiaceae bacterium]|nr:FAD-binding protein [Streptosporangiaceae bacterium]